MHVVFRADASRVIGSGHVMRCLTLAEVLRSRGVAVSFVSRAQDGNLCDLVEARGIAVTRLPAFGAAPDVPEALDAEWERDARESRCAIERTCSETRPDWLVVDHYGLDARYERAVRSAVDRVLVIDDIANRAHDCDALLDQNLVADRDARYDGRVPAGCERLLGPDYALLQPAYAAARAGAHMRDGRVRRILVYFGGADRDGLTLRTLRAIARIDADVAVDVVIGLASDQIDAVRAIASERANATVYFGLPNLADLMARADLAIGAGGSSTWERLCLGLPTLAVILAENQRPIVEELAPLGMVRSLGTAQEATCDAIRAAVTALVASGIPTEWLRACESAVDGHGAGRVAAALGAAPGSPLRARDVTAQDEALVLEWVNDPATRANAFSPAAISAAEHHRWFTARLGEGDRCRYFIIEQAGTPIGQVRFQRADSAWELHYVLGPSFRGRRLAAPMLAVALQQLRTVEGSASVFGRVKPGNERSCRVFDTLGFNRTSAPGADVITYARAA